MCERSEREASRTAGEGNDRTPSPLFEVKEDAVKFFGSPVRAKICNANGTSFSSHCRLSRQPNGRAHPGAENELWATSAHADRLLDIIADDREEALFALRCIHRESPWVVHGLSVADETG